MMKTGLDFEWVLKRCLLEFTDTLPNGAPGFRYAYHEVIEEAQHWLMLYRQHGFVNGAGHRRYQRYCIPRVLEKAQGNTADLKVEAIR